MIIDELSISKHYLLIMYIILKKIKYYTTK